MQTQFPYLVHAVALHESRLSELVCTIAGFNSRGYAEEFARKHAVAAKDLIDLAIVVTDSDVGNGALIAFAAGAIIDLVCPCIGGCIEAHS